jgi:hypothetical protein
MKTTKPAIASFQDVLTGETLDEQCFFNHVPRAGDWINAEWVESDDSDNDALYKVHAVEWNVSADKGESSRCYFVTIHVIPVHNDQIRNYSPRRQHPKGIAP